MEEKQGIYRGEVLAIMTAITHILADTSAIRTILEEDGTTMKRKRWTPEEWRAWRAEREPTQRELRAHIERIKAELAAKKASQ